MTKGQLLKGFFLGRHYIKQHSVLFMEKNWVDQCYRRWNQQEKQLGQSCMEYGWDLFFKSLSRAEAWSRHA